MKEKRHIEIFSAGCPVCEKTIRIVNELVCSSCEVEVLDINNPDVAERAAALSIRSIPAVVVDAQLAECCAWRGVSSTSLREAGVGVPL
ncbi:MAG: thioredoxin family protein [Bacteroidetes bacterium]|nr:thioredoxin family protein [Bacteroidota bacterium]